MSELALCRSLVARADRLLHRHPGRALELARAARTLAAGVERDPGKKDDAGAGVGDSSQGADCSQGEWLALQTAAWSVLASAARSVGDLAQAEAALNVALCFLGDPAYPAARRHLDQARVAQRAAYLRAAQHRFDEALDLIDEATEIYDRLGARPGAATCRVDRAAILATAGRTGDALDTLIHTLETRAADLPRLGFLAAVHNVAVYLHELGDEPAAAAEALGWLRLAIRCHRRFPESVEQLKLVTLWGLTAARLGAVERGMTALEEAVAGFGRHGAVVDQTMTLLDLARLALAHRRPRRLRFVAGAIFPLLHRLRRHPGVRDGLLQVLRAIHAGTLERALLEDVRRQLDAA